MDIKHLTTFVTFVKEGSYNRVSQKLNYSVSTLVTHIASLEEEFQVELIHSQGRKSQLTAAGRAFIPLAESILSAYQKAYVAMGSLRALSGNLSLAVSETVGLTRLASVYSTFIKENPQVNMTVFISSRGYADQQLYDRTADVLVSQAFLPIKKDGILSIPLYDEPLVLVAPPTHPLANKVEIHTADLERQTLIFPRRDYMEQPTLKRILSESNAKVKEGLFLDSGILIKHVLRDSRMLSFLPMSSIETEVERGELIQLPWCDEKIFMKVYAFYLEKSLNLPLIESLISFVQDVVQNT